MITVRADSTYEGLRSKVKATRDYASIVRRGGCFFLKALDGNADPSIRVVEIGIADSGGINCKVRGVLVRGASSRLTDNRMVYGAQEALKLFSSGDERSRKALQFLSVLQSHPLFAPAAPFAKPSSYESTHPYSDGDNTHKQPTSIKIADADRYEVKFDSQCHTEADTDTLIFTVKGEPVANGIYHGHDKENGWAPLTIHGNEFEFKFVVDSGSSRNWGYKFTIHPIKDTENFSGFGERLNDSLAVAICQLCITESGVFSLPFTLTEDGQIVESSLVPVLQGCLARCMQYEHIRCAVERALASIFTAEIDRSKSSSLAVSSDSDRSLQCGAFSSV